MMSKMYLTAIGDKYERYRLSVLHNVIISCQKQDFSCNNPLTRIIGFPYISIFCKRSHYSKLIEYHDNLLTEK